MEDPEERIRKLEAENERLRLELWRLRRKPSGTVGYALLLVGAAMLALSIFYSSTAPALVGLGLTFWGALLLYVRPMSYVKAALLGSTASSSILALERVLGELGYDSGYGFGEEKGNGSSGVNGNGKGNGKGKGSVRKAIYLPPRFLKEVKGGTVFLPYGEGEREGEREALIPSVEEVAEGRVLLKNPRGLCIPAPGVRLANLYEEELGVEFSKTDMGYLEASMPRLFVEGLEMAEAFEMEAEKDLVRVRIKGSVYAGLCREIRGSSRICPSIGCPLCSSIACALARSTGKPVVIEENRLSEDGRTIEVLFRVLEVET